jgi:uncharacterized membrane protein
VAIIVAFTALTSALNLISIPAPYNPYFSYRIGDIVLVSAFLIFGFKIGLTIGALNMFISMTVFSFGSPANLVGAPYYLVAILTMVLGVYIYEKFVKSKIGAQRALAKSATIATVLGIFTRTLIMLSMDYTIFGYLVSLVSGLSFADAQNMVLVSMPTIILYNITVALYVIPISYYLAKQIRKHKIMGIQNTLTE